MLDTRDTEVNKIGKVSSLRFPGLTISGAVSVLNLKTQTIRTAGKGTLVQNMLHVRH